ncbi:hypothetical protein IMSAGC021_01071 [Muribaculaceae bacterium]|nr:hypothetical protein IMSAGC021_01071 [Muribaculaceae bacterium]
MIGEDAEFERVVGETFMDRRHDGREGYVVAAVGEDYLQALDLLLAVAEDADAVALGEEAGETLADQLEILVVDGLRGAVEVNRGPGGGVGLSGGREAQLTERAEGTGEGLAVDHLLHGVGVGAVIYSGQGALRKLLGAYGPYALHGVEGVADHEEGRGIDELQQRLA